MTPSLTKRGAGTLERRHDNPTDHIRSQVSFFDWLVWNSCKSIEILDHSSPGGDLSDEELCTGIANLGGRTTPIGAPSHDFIEPLCFSTGSNVMEFAQSHCQQQQQFTRSRSGSCTSRRSQCRWVLLLLPLRTHRFHLTFLYPFLNVLRFLNLLSFSWFVWFLYVTDFG